MIVTMVIVLSVIVGIIKFAQIHTNATLIKDKIKIRKRSKQYIYFIQVRGSLPLLVKIGKTKNYAIRFRAYNTILPKGLRVLAIIPVWDCDRAERFLHSTFQKNRIRKDREWFLINLTMIVTILVIGEKTHTKRGQYYGR